MNWLKISFRLCVMLVGAAVAFSRVSAETVTLRPVADAEIREFSPTSNFGSGPTVVSGRLGDNVNNEIRRAMLQFDLAAQIPAGARINSATLEVKVVRVPLNPANSTFGLRRLLQSWSELGVTWNSRSSLSTPWQVPGATGVADLFPSASSTVFVSGLGTYTFSSTVSLVADLQNWVNSPGTNFGWLLISEGEVIDKTARQFGAREDPNNTPVLVVDYSIVSPSISLQPLSQTVAQGDTVTFSVDAAGTSPLSYQWQFNTNDLPNATNSILLLPNVQTNDTGSYTVIVRNPAGFVVSQPAILEVFPRSAFQPQVNLLSPANGALFPINSNVLVTAEAMVGELVSNAAISQIEFFTEFATNRVSVGVISNTPASVMLGNLAVGEYRLTARATDTEDNVGNSTNLVGIRIVAPPLPTIVAPEPGARFRLGTNIAVTASILPPSLFTDIERVEFFVNGSKIGETFSSPSNFFNFIWTPTVEQEYVLTAVATDILGQTGSSTPVTNRVLVFEVIKPTITITSSPPNFKRTNSQQISLAGTANDNQRVDFIELVINGVTTRAVGTTNWQAEITLTPGPNDIRVHSVDFFGNVSFDDARHITYVVNDTLTVSTDGPGSVVPDLNGLREIGQVYTITAVPDPGNIFAGWDFHGNEVVGNSNNATLSFVMQSNLVLTAHFISNPFATLNGSYAGLFYDHDTNTIAPESTGIFILQVGRLGAVSGKLTINGDRHSYHGRFNNQLEATLSVVRRQLTPVILNLRFDPADTAGQVRGSVVVLVSVSVTNLVDGTNSVIRTNISRTAELLGYRSVFQRLSQPAPQAGAYPFDLKREDNLMKIATGVARINASSHVRFRGNLNGRKFSLATSLGQDGDCPFYISPRGGSEAIIGWLRFPNEPTATFGTNLFWVRSGANGFLLRVDAVPSQP